MILDVEKIDKTFERWMAETIDIPLNDNVPEALRSLGFKGKHPWSFLNKYQPT